MASPVEASSPRSSVNVHRSNTSRRPFLSIDPVEYSLTEGTNIPSPIKDVTPPESPISPVHDSPQEQSRLKPSLSTSLTAATSNGPLSSHPVTPIEAPNGSEKGGYPFNRQNSSSISSNGQRNGNIARVSSPTGSQRVVTPITSSPLSHHQHNGLPQPGRVMTPPDSDDHHQRVLSQMQQPQRDSTRSRRPSFAERFLRFRSLSSLRGKNTSNTSVGLSHHVHNDGSEYMNGHHTQPSTEAFASSTMPARGIKRPGSPSIAGIFRTAEQSDGAADSSWRESQSFPRMVRKKSMELLGTARRKSGMWSGRDPMNTMMQEEYERERMRESEMSGETEERKDSMVTDGRASKVSSHRRDSLKEPPPMLPELESLKEMEGDSMFSSIGKE